jgi:galactokinase
VDIPALRSRFAALFPDGHPQQLRLAQAPGRVNLIGEHTDYNDGFVCPMAIDRNTAVIFRPRTDAVVRIHSASADQHVEFAIDRPVAKDGPVWALYPKGVAEILRQKKLINHGIDALVDSEVPIGGGLSSSASFEVATAFALLAANAAEMPLVDLALACQWAEHNYPGMPCGIMDQFICSMGQKGRALLLDCRDRSTRQVLLNDPALRIVISNTNVKHELVMGEYTARRHQCEASVSWLRKKFPQVRSLRDATMDMLEDGRLGMDPTAFRRARHVISEIQRTTDFAAALEARDYVRCGNLMYGSHESLRDDYAVSCAELDALVAIARTVPGVYGARMTGGGFGGCIVALCTADAVAPLTARIDAEYPRKSAGKKATTFATVASEGAKVVG